MAIEKCLMVTGEAIPTPDPPPAPLLSSLGPVNVNPPSSASASASYDGGPVSMVVVEADWDGPGTMGPGGRASRSSEDVDGGSSAAFVNSVIEVVHHQHNHRGPGASWRSAEAGGPEGAASAGHGAAASSAGVSGSHSGGGKHMEHIEVGDHARPFDEDLAIHQLATRLRPRCTSHPELPRG